jgi:6-phosphogluconolactonase
MMNVLRFDRNDCKKFQAYLDLYLDNELLVETTHEGLTHLENCPNCFDALSERRRVKGLLRSAVLKDSAPADLQEKIRKKIRKDPLAKRTRLMVLAAAMITFIVVGGSPQFMTGRTIASGHVAATMFRSPDSPATAGGFVYTITNSNGPNSIAAYQEDRQSGELSFIATYSTGGRGSGRFVDSQRPLVINAEGTRLYAVNPASNDISVMAIKQDGALELIGVPVPSRGMAPASLALSRDFLFVANKGDAATTPNYAGFRVASDGTLTPARQPRELNVGDNPTQVLFSRDGRMLIGLRFGGRIIDCYRVKTNGKLRVLAQLENQSGPFAAVFNPIRENHLLVSDARLPGAASYLIGDGGAVVPVSTISNAPERAACWIAVHPGGLYAWVANTGTSSLSLYTINSDDTLTLAGTHSTAAFGRAPFEIVLDETGQHLYELNTAAGSQSIHLLRVTGNTADAGLADVATYGLPAGSAPIGLAIIPPSL